MGQHLSFSIEMLLEETINQLAQQKENLPFHQIIVSLSFIKGYPYIDDTDSRIDILVFGVWNEQYYRYFV